MLKKVHDVALPPNNLKARLNQDMLKGQRQIVEH
jgi:hypothetical protein